MEILRMRGEALTFKEILAEADLLGRKFTVKQNSLIRALDRACESEVQRIFTRTITDEKFASNGKLMWKYGLANW